MARRSLSHFLHNDCENSMPRVVVILKKVIPGMTLKKATAIMQGAHRTGQALVKSCHKELAELYEGRLRGEGLTVSIESTDEGADPCQAASRQQPSPAWALAAAAARFARTFGARRRMRPAVSAEEPASSKEG